MTGHIAYAHGSPCPTLVLDRRLLPADDTELLARFVEIRRHLSEAGAGHIMKNALIQPSSHPLYDLDYRFIQSLPGGPERFDTRGSCGHSILSAIVSAAQGGMLPRLSVGDRIRVNVLNNGDNVVCEVDSLTREATSFTAHFLRSPATPVEELLMTGEPVTKLSFDGRTIPVTLVSAGNPYVFVSAADLGAPTREALFADDDELFDRMMRCRAAACDALGWSRDGVFPKIAALVAGPDGRVAARAISVPSWHPTLALTGITCLGAAARIEGTIPHAFAHTDSDTELLEIDTPGGTAAVTASVVNSAGKQCLTWVSVGRKAVSFHGSFAFTPINHLRILEEAACLPVPI